MKYILEITLEMNSQNKWEIVAKHIAGNTDAGHPVNMVLATRDTQAEAQKTFTAICRKHRLTDVSWANDERHIIRHATRAA